MLKDKKSTKIARVVLEHSTNFGSALTLSLAIRHYVPLHPNRLIRATQHVGTFGLIGVASDAASKFVVGQFDSVVAVIDSY